MSGVRLALRDHTNGTDIGRLLLSEAHHDSPNRLPAYAGCSCEQNTTKMFRRLAFLFVTRPRGSERELALYFGPLAQKVVIDARELNGGRMLRHVLVQALNRHVQIE